MSATSGPTVAALVGTARHTTTPTRRWRCAAVAAGALLTLTLAGCQFATPIESTHDNNVDGTVSMNIDGVDIRDAVLVSDTDTGAVTDASFIFVAENQTDQPAAVTFTWKDKTGQQRTDVVIPADAALSRGTTLGDQQLLVSNLRLQAGALLPVGVSVNGRSTRILEVPILTTAYPQYRHLGPA
jgi:hypothetical protein